MNGGESLVLRKSSPAEPIRLAFFGHACAASAAALAGFFAGRETEAGLAIAPTNAVGDEPVNHHDSGHELVSVILAGTPSERPAEPERLAARLDIPVVWVSSAAEAADALRVAAPDVAVAACFPWKLPRAARVIPPLGILNIHPSLLPAGRGQEPVFWTLRRGEPTTGVTVHRMDSGFDTGPILTQAEQTIPLGIGAPDLENALMALGARLLLQALPALADGSRQPQPQPLLGVSHAPLPAAADWTMSPLLPAAWAWRFARGVAPLGGPLAVVSGGALIPVADALEWSPDERLPERVVAEDDGTLRVRFTPGWVRFSHRS